MAEADLEFDADRDDHTILVLQGGGALGAYQAGVYEALAENGHRPGWIAGISIGAINAALIAGNRPEDRVARLHAFWHGVSTELPLPSPLPDGAVRRWFNEAAAAMAFVGGVPGLFRPRLLPWWLAAPGSPEAISMYDTSPLRRTLLDLVDFDRLNHPRTRFSVGAVNVLTGNLVFFDNTERRIGPEHVMASGALPPAFPPVMIDGEPYWDGGLVSNTPLQYVLDNRPPGEATIFQVDLFSANGAMPLSLGDALQREKDIRFSSRTRVNTDLNKQIERMHEAARRLAAKVPEDLRDDHDLRTLVEARQDGAMTILHLINRSEGYETQSKDLEFSRDTIAQHWASGRADVETSLAHPRWRGRKPRDSGVVTLDLAGSGIEA